MASVPILQTLITVSYTHLTSELGIYEMMQGGLRQVSNPSELLLTEDHDGLSGVAISLSLIHI